MNLSKQLVASFPTKDFYLGKFGLGPKPTNLLSFDDPLPSYMKNLTDQNLIPSLSFEYTAGAKHRLSESPTACGTLTLGGYDEGRFTPNNLTFPFTEDDSRSLTVGLQSIIISNASQGALNPLTTGAYLLIESTVPYIWLPKSTCQLFEQAFGLIYDPTTDLYLVNDSVHTSLQQPNPTVAFKIGVTPNDGATIDMDLPYGAFDLQATFPIYQM